MHGNTFTAESGHKTRHLDDVMDEMENNEATGMFEYAPEPEHLSDAEILDESFLDDYEDFDATDVLEDDFGFVADDF